MRTLSWPVGVVSALSPTSEMRGFATITSLGCSEIEGPGVIHFVLKRNSFLLSIIQEGAPFSYSLLNASQESLAVSFGKNSQNGDNESALNSLLRGSLPRTIIVSNCCAVLYLRFKMLVQLKENSLVFCEVLRCEILKESVHLSYWKQQYY